MLERSKPVGRYRSVIARDETTVTHGVVMKERAMRVGVLTGGGDCPGLNAVVRPVVRKGVGEYGFEFVGFLDGWRGPLENMTTALGVDEVRGILPPGGTLLKASRTNPFKI